MVSEFSVPSVSRVKGANVPAGHFMVVTVAGTRIALKNEWYEQLKRDILNAAEVTLKGQPGRREINYISYTAEYPWAVLVFPLMWNQPGWRDYLEGYTTYDPYDADNCSGDMEDMALRIISKKARSI